MTRRRGRGQEVALALAIVTILAADGYALTRRTNATTVAVDEAVRRFREDQALAPTTSSTVAPSGAPAAVPHAPPTSTGETAPPTSTSRPAAPASPAMVRPAATPAQAGAGLLRPDPGVYRYATQGFESVSILGTQRSYPPETTRTVRHGTGCAWTFRIVLLEEHQEEHVACSRPGILDMTGSTNDVRWFGLATSTRLACDPPIRHVDAAARAGTSAPFLCRAGDDSTFAGTATLLGEESVAVDGQARRAWRLSLSGRFEGRTRGTVTVTELIDQETGITILEQRTNDIRQQSPVGDVAYRQEVTLRISSLQPAR